MRDSAPEDLKASVGPFDSLVRQPIVCLMGQCDLIASILCLLQKASVGPFDSLMWQLIVGLMGQCDLIASILP